MTERNLIEILENVNLDPQTQITVLDTTYNVVAVFPSELNIPRVELSESELRQLSSVHPEHPVKHVVQPNGSEWLVKLSHIEDGRYYLMMAGSRTIGLSTFYQRLGIYLFLLTSEDHAWDSEPMVRHANR